MNWWMKFGFGHDPREDDGRIRRRIEAQERAAHALANEVRRIDQMLEAIRRELGGEDAGRAD
jgi:hypothetical protein